MSQLDDILLQAANRSRAMDGHLAQILLIMLTETEKNTTRR